MSMNRSSRIIGLQRRHEDKHKIKFKLEGDDFIVDYCFDNGFACYFNFRIMPPQTNHARLKLSTLHSRVLDLIDASLDRNHK